MNFLKKVKNNLFKIITLSAVVLIIGFLAKNKFLPVKAVYDAKKDTLVTVKRQTIKNELALSGSVDAASKADLRFQTSGQLSWVGVGVGDRVKKWQSIAALDKRQLKKQLQKEMNDYLTNRWNFEDTQDEYKTTKENHLITTEMQRILDRTQFSLNNAVLDVELSDLTLKYATIYSPIDGVVTSIEQPNPGVNITPSTATFTVVDPNSIYFKCELDQEDVIKVNQNQKVTIKLDSYPDQIIDSQIDYISFSPVAGQTSTVYETRLKLPQDNDDLKYRLGMDGDASIILSQSENTLIIPSTAILEQGDQKFVYVDINGKLDKKSITTGIESDEKTEVLSGLSENDSVVIKKK